MNVHESSQFRWRVIIITLAATLRQMEADLDDTETRRMSALESMERIVKELQPTEVSLPDVP